MSQETYNKIKELEAEKDALVKAVQDKGGMDAISIAELVAFKRKREMLQDSLDSLYRALNWD